MLIEINRIYVSSGMQVKMLINTDFIKKVDTVIEEDMHSDIAATRIILLGFDKDDVIYSIDSYATLKAKLTKARNRK